MKKQIVLYAAFFVCLAAIPGMVGWGQAAEKQIQVGAIFGFTGPQAVGGEGVCGGIRDYLAWVDQKGGIEYTEPSTGKKERVKISLVWEDSQGDPGRSVMIYKRLKAAGAKVILGFTSSSSEAVAAMASQDRIPVLALYACASPAGYKPKPPYYMASLPTITECVLGATNWFIGQWKGSRRPKIAVLSADFPRLEITRVFPEVSGHL